MGPYAGVLSGFHRNSGADKRDWANKPREAGHNETPSNYQKAALNQKVARESPTPQWKFVKDIKLVVLFAQAA